MLWTYYSTILRHNIWDQDRAGGNIVTTPAFAAVLYSCQDKIFWNKKKNKNPSAVGFSKFLSFLPHQFLTTSAGSARGNPPTWLFTELLTRVRYIIWWPHNLAEKIYLFQIYLFSKIQQLTSVSKPAHKILKA